MTFSKLFKILDLLYRGKEIIIQEDPYDGQVDVEPYEFRYVDRITADDMIEDYKDYFLDSKYHFFEADGDFTGDEIK